jgi:CYTH domain-containing protein/predicted ATPase
MCEPKIHKIVLTGGPCAGKTTCMTQLAARLNERGFLVYVVPEAATLLLGGGISLAGLSPSEIVGFQGRLIRLQMLLEDTFEAQARVALRDAVLLCDRGAMDARAYVSGETWQALLDEQGWTNVGLRDQRYTAVLHLVTAAVGAEEFYTTANNAARSETPAEAIALDQKLQQAWTGHPHLRVIDNSSDFSHKIRRTTEAACRVLGVPAPTEIERKYLVRSIKDPFPISSTEVLIEQTYLTTQDGSQARVRRRSADGASVYTHTIKRPLQAGQRVEIEHPISSREYLSLLAQADPSKKTIRKKRRCFLWANQYFELDTFLDPHPGLSILEIELDDPSHSPPLPPCIEIEREVTEDPLYGNEQLAGDG